MLDKISFFDKSSNVEHDPNELLSIIALGPIATLC